MKSLICGQPLTASCQATLELVADRVECLTDSVLSMEKRISQLIDERLRLADEYHLLKERHGQTCWWSDVTSLVNKYQQLVDRLSSQVTSAVVEQQQPYGCLLCSNCKAKMTKDVFDSTDKFRITDVSTGDKSASAESHHSHQTCNFRLCDCVGNRFKVPVESTRNTDMPIVCDDTALSNDVVANATISDCTSKEDQVLNSSEVNCRSSDLDFCCADNDNIVVHCQCKESTCQNLSAAESLVEINCDETYNEGKRTNEKIFEEDSEPDQMVCNASTEIESSCSKDVEDSGQSVGSDCRQVFVESPETYASIIGREIAASFNMQETEADMSLVEECSALVDVSQAICDKSSSQSGVKNGPNLSTRGQNGVELSRTALKLDPDLSPSLDTVEVAQRVRDVLTANNVGQRQFARHVLGLSQGTVGELLAKPKPWDRLTEKSRESYRKMHEWVGDQVGILALKTSSVRKETGSMLNMSKHDNDPKLVTEQRIAQILSEAQFAMQQSQTKLNAKDGDSNGSVCDSALRSSANNLVMNSDIRPLTSRPKRDRRRGATSDAVTSSGITARSGRRSAALSATESITSATSTTTTCPARDLVARIYEEELRKLVAAAELSGNTSDVAMYNRELARLAFAKSGSLITNGCSGAETDIAIAENKENCENRSASVIEAEDGASLDVPQDLSMSRSADTFNMSEPSDSDSIPSSCGSPEDDRREDEKGDVGADGVLSPLQRMQCIANSLPVTPSATQTAALSSQTSKPQLPPIATEQLASCEEINTDDLVAKIKDMLGQFSISQRLFGEAVLGLSQGSVSDLLARPKPWPLLTQKGREPFVRMQAFLDDPDAISKLVSTQYRVPAEKLLRSNSSNGLFRSSPATDTNSQLVTGMSSTSTSSAVLTTFPSVATPTFRSSITVDGSFRGLIADVPPAHNNSCFSPPAGMIPIASCTTPVMSNGVGNGVMSMGTTMFPFLPVTSYFATPQSHVASVMMAVDFRPLYGQQQPTSAMPIALTTTKQEPVLPVATVSDAAAVDEIDTQELTVRVRDVLQTHGLGQKLFGEAVLELSQGSVSELLAKPKPWGLLSAKGREPFMRMRTWLSDPQGIERLRTFQSQAAVTGNKRKLSPDSGSESSSGLNVTTPQKKPRLFFTEEQKTALRQAYIADPYPNQAAIERLAADVGVGVKTVVNWFHNHRMRAKQQTTHGVDMSGSATSPSSSLPHSTSVKLEEDTASGDQFASRSKNAPLSIPRHSDSAACHEMDDHISDHTSVSGIFAATRNPSVFGTNKRKRARPHKLSSEETSRRAKIDRSVLIDESKYCRSEGTEVPIDLSVLRPKFTSRDPSDDLGCEKNKDAREQRDYEALNSDSQVAVEWCDNERERNIERLQKNLNQEPADDWEF